MLLAALLLTASPQAALAKGTPDLSAGGSITVRLASGEASVDSGSLAFYRVGEPYHEDGDYAYRLTADFADSGVSLEDIHSPRSAEALAAFADERGLEGSAVQVENGSLTFRVPRGQLGLYLVMQELPAQGWEPIRPFLVSVPAFDGGAYRYDVDATPKVGEPVPIPPEPDVPESDVPEPPSEVRPPVFPWLPRTGDFLWITAVPALVGLVLFIAGRRARSRSDEDGRKD